MTVYRPDSRLWLWFAAWLAATPAIAQTPAPQTITYDYLTREGDTCLKIAAEQFGGSGHYHAIHQHNPWLKGMPLPHRFEPGTVLKLPFAAGGNTGPDAELTAMQRRVEARSPADELWRLAKLGLELFRGWQVSTWEKAAAEITFRDESTLNIRENTLVILFGTQKNTTKTQRFSARLEKGALRSRLDALSGRPTVTVATPSATATLRDGETLVSVDEDAMCRVSNFQGKPVVLTSISQPKTIAIASGYGSRVAKGGRPEKPRLLPDSPVWRGSHGGLVVGVEGVGASVSGQWAKVNRAIGYRVELARRSDGGDVILAAFVPGDIDRFEAHGLPNGWYFVAVSAVDVSGLESRPSLRQALLVRLATPLPKDGVRDNWPDQAQPETTTPLPAAPRILVGTILQFHDGILCDSGENKRSSTIPLYHDGPTELRCRDIEQRAAFPLRLDVVRPVLSFPAATRGEPLVVTRGLRQSIPLQFDSAVPLPPTLQILGPPGVELAVERSEAGLPTAVWVTADHQVSSPFTLEVVVQNETDAAVLNTFSVTAQRQQDTTDLSTAVVPAPLNPTQPARLTDQSLSSSVIGVRDLETRQHMVSLGLGVISTGPKGIDEVVQLALAAETTWLDNALRVGLGHGFHFGNGLQNHTAVRQASRLRADLFGVFSVGKDLWISAGLTGWLPTFADHQGNRTTSLVPSTDIQHRFAERFVIRTRQGALLDLSTHGHIMWAQAYALDVWLWGPLALSTELNFNLGAIDSHFAWQGAITPMLHIDTGIVTTSIGPTIPFNDETRLRFGNFSLLLTGAIFF